MILVPQPIAAEERHAFSPAEFRARVEELPSRWAALTAELDRLDPGRAERRATLDPLPRHERH